MSRLAPLSEEPVVNEDDTAKNKCSGGGGTSSSRKLGQTCREWIKNHFPLLLCNKKSDLKILLSVLACPLFPVSLHPTKSSISQVSSSSQYIIHHFTAATGCREIEGKVKNMYATGKVTMAMVDELGSNGSASANLSQKGCFVMWQMVPNKWLIELVVSGQKIAAGSDGNLAWRHTPWLGAHAAKGGVRPLRRALQGLDPLAISEVFSQAAYMGEKRACGTDCFVLKVSADHSDLADRSDSTAEMIKHVMFGYFSQRSGLLVYLEDSYLTRIQAPGSHPMYWETIMASKVDDYRAADGGAMVAHSGHSNVAITRFGDNLKAGPVVTRMEETWTIDDLAFNVPGLSIDCFIPPKEVQKDFPLNEQNCDEYFWKSPLLNR